MTHTPGPWLIDANPYEVWTAKGPGYGLVCHVAPYCPPDVNSEQGKQFTANAKLIAAAPKLLEALKYLTREFKNVVQSEFETRTNRMPWLKEDAYNEAMRLIAEIEPTEVQP